MRIMSFDLLSRVVRRSLAEVSEWDAAEGVVVTYGDGSTGAADKNLWLLVSSRLFSALLVGMFAGAAPLWFASHVPSTVGHVLLAIGLFAFFWPVSWMGLFHALLLAGRIVGTHEGSIISDTMQAPKRSRTVLVSAATAVGAIVAATLMTP
jgi:hypothetical protein